MRVALRITDSVGPFLLAEDSPRGTGQREVITDVARRLGLPVVLSGDQAPPPPAADPAQRIGKVAVIPVGMCQVSSVHMYDTLVGQTVAKGAEFGYFGFGGSDIIMLFEPNANLELLGYDVHKNAIHFLYGQVAGYWNRQPG